MKYLIPIIIWAIGTSALGLFIAESFGHGGILFFYIAIFFGATGALVQIAFTHRRNFGLSSVAATSVTVAVTVLAFTPVLWFFLSYIGAEASLSGVVRILAYAAVFTGVVTTIINVIYPNKPGT